MIDVIKEKVIDKMKDHPKRLAHIIGVAETAAKLAKIYGIPEEKAMIAGLYHDMAKYDSLSEQMNMMDLRWIKAYADFPVIYHAIAAANMLEHEFRVHDHDILNAIRYHVWGRKEMSMLEKIIFVADSCEPNRPFDDIDYIYDLATKDIDQAVCYCMKQSILDVKKKKLVPSDEQLEAYEYYLEVTRGKIK